MKKTKTKTTKRERSKFLGKSLRAVPQMGEREGVSQLELSSGGCRALGGYRSFCIASGQSCDWSRHIQESPRPRAPKSPKSLKKVLSGVKKTTKSVFGDFFDTFLTLRAGRPGNAFLRLLGISGLGGVKISCIIVTPLAVHWATKLEAGPSRLQAPRGADHRPR